MGINLSVWLLYHITGAAALTVYSESDTRQSWYFGELTVYPIKYAKCFVVLWLWYQLKSDLCDLFVHILWSLLQWGMISPGLVKALRVGWLIKLCSSKPQPNSTKHKSCAYFFWSILSNISISNSYPRLSSNISEFSEWWKVCKWSWSQNQTQTTRSLAISFLFSLIYPHLSGQQSVHPESTIRTLVSLYTLGRQTVVFVLFWFVYVYGWIFLRLNHMLFTSHTNLGIMTRVLKSLLVDGHFLT